MSRVVCLGECMVELAPVGEDLYRRSFAGDTFNTAWYLRALLPEAWEVDYASCVGDDDLSRQMRAFAADAGIGVTRLREIPGRTVGLYMISLKDGERSFTYWRSASAARALAADAGWLGDQLRDAGLILFSGITVAIVPPGERGTLFAAVAEARQAGATVAFDPNIRMRLWPDAATARAALAAAGAVSDILLPSFEDEAALFGDATPEETIRRYRADGVRTVVVKNGADAVVAWDAAEGPATHLPPPVDVSDTTAAGDSFNAACLAARIQGGSLHAAIAAGARLAGRVCQSPGALVRL